MFSEQKYMLGNYSKSHPMQSDTVMQITNFDNGSCHFPLLEMDQWDINKN